VRFWVFLCVALSSAALAQSYPTKPVRLIVPFPPGGATDIVGRMVAAKMQEVWRQTVVVENKPGAGTVVGTDAVAKAPPDGYTLGVVVTAHVINPSLRSSLPSEEKARLAAFLEGSLTAGEASIDDIARRAAEAQPGLGTAEELAAYLRGFRYRLGEDEEAGLARFRALWKEYRLDA